MKIRPSLRLYFLVGVLFLGTITVASFSVISVNNFLDGMDAVTRGFLIDTAKRQSLVNDRAVSILDVSVASRWEDMPASVREHFSEPPQEFNTLYKYLDQDRWYQRPHEVHMVIKVKLDDGSLRYASRSFNEIKTAVTKPSGFHFGPVETTILLSLGMLVIFWVLLLMLLRNIAVPMEKLREWASKLSADNLTSKAPDFRYSELNALAELIRTSLMSVQQSLQREHDFLKHASHELRTPIAVVRSSVELLKRLLPEPHAKQKAVLQRIENAGYTMSDLTDTLLWLSREDELPTATQDVKLADLLTQLSEELHYLLSGKPVQLNLNCTATTLVCNLAACRIVFANLIRNAFQHTQNGWVTIEQKGAEVVITNHNNDVLSEESTELGFGLGLNLTEKLTKRLGWHYDNQAQPTGHKVIVRVGSQQTVLKV